MPLISSPPLSLLCSFPFPPPPFYLYTFLPLHPFLFRESDPFPFLPMLLANFAIALAQSREGIIIYFGGGRGSLGKVEEWRGKMVEGIDETPLSLEIHPTVGSEGITRGGIIGSIL